MFCFNSDSDLSMSSTATCKANNVKTYVHWARETTLTETIHFGLESWNFKWHVFASMVCWPVSEVYIETSNFELVFRIYYFLSLEFVRVFSCIFLDSGSVVQFSAREPAATLTCSYSVLLSIKSVTLCRVKAIFFVCIFSTMAVTDH